MCSLHISLRLNRIAQLNSTLIHFFSYEVKSPPMLLTKFSISIPLCSGVQNKNILLKKSLGICMETR